MKTITITQYIGRLGITTLPVKEVTKSKVNLTTFPTISGHPLHEIKDENSLVSDRPV